MNSHIVKILGLWLLVSGVAAHSATLNIVIPADNAAVTAPFQVAGTFNCAPQNFENLAVWFDDGTIRSCTLNIDQTNKTFTGTCDYKAAGPLGPTPLIGRLDCFTTGAGDTVDDITITPSGPAPEEEGEGEI